MKPTYLHTVLALLAATLLCGCGSRTAYRRSQLDSLQQANVADSVFRSDSIQRLLADYFDQHGTPNDRMKAHYLLGRAHSDMGDAPQALQDYHNAADCADTTAADCDFHILNRVHSQIASIFSRLYMPNNELAELEIAKHYAMMDNDTLSAVIYDALRAESYTSLHQPDSVLAIRERVAQRYERMGFPQYAAMQTGLKATHLIEEGKLDEAWSCIMTYRKSSGYYDDEGNLPDGHKIFYFTEGNYFRAAHRLDSAEYFYRKLERESDNYNDQICAARGLWGLYDDLHNTDSVAKYASRSYALSDSAYVRSIAATMQQMQAQYNYSSHQKKAIESLKEANKERRKRWTITVLCVVVVVFISSVGLILIYRQRNREKNKQAELDDVREMYLQDKIQLERARAEIERQEATARSNAIEIEKLETEIRHLEISASHSDQLKRAEILAKSAEVRKLKALLAQKQKAIIELSQKLDEYEQRVSDDVPLSEREDERQMLLNVIFSSQIYLVFQRISNKVGCVPKNSDWIQLEKFMESLMPNLRGRLKEANHLSEDEYRLCLLDMLRFSLSDITRLLCKSYSWSSKTRRSLLQKIFHKDGRPHEFDQRIQKLI